MKVIMVLILLAVTPYSFAKGDRCSGNKCCAHWSADKKCASEYTCTECSLITPKDEKKRCTKEGKCCAHWKAAGDCAHKYTCTDCP